MKTDRELPESRRERPAEPRRRATEQDAWQAVSRRAPCPACGKTDWCRTSPDGRRVICRRESRGSRAERVDRQGVTYWLHATRSSASDDLTISDDRCLELLRHGTIPSRRASTAVLHRAYSRLLDLLFLAPSHEQDLRRRGLDDAQIARGRYRSLRVEGRSRLARRLVQELGEGADGVPGLVLRDGSRGPFWWLAGPAGLLVPVRDIDGHVVALKVRRDDPGDGPKYLYVSGRRFRGPGPGAPVHVPVFCAGLSRTTVRLIEGELKADVVTCLTGQPTISIPGVSSWRAGIKALRRLRPQQVVLAFDADARRNPHVAQALRAAARAITTEGW